MTNDALLEQQAQDELPDTWVCARIDEVYKVNPTIRWDDENFYDDMPITFVPMAAVDEFTGTILDGEIRSISEVWTGYKRFREGDVIFARITPSMENGKAAIAINLKNGVGTGSTEFHVLHPPQADDMREIMAKWVFHFIKQEQFRGDAAHKMTGTAGQLRVPANFMESYKIPLAPLNEQRRIIEEIEAQFTRLDAGIAALKRLEANLKRYKTSVLKAACEGDLIPQDPNDEPASELLDKMSVERRGSWEVVYRYDKYDSKGKKPPKGWKSRYKTPQEPETDDLSELPEGWQWAGVEEVSLRIVDCLHSTPKFQEDGFVCIDTNCIKPGKIVDDKIRYVDEDTFHDRNRRMIPQAHDVMFSREGALLGVAVEVPEGLELCLGQRMMVFRLSQFIEPKFFEHVLNSMTFRLQYFPKISGSASPHLNISDIRKMAIPLPPINEQKRILEAVDMYMSIIEQLESMVERGLRKAERLRQSILKEAFAGRLVPQDPYDEPASELLARIQAERRR